MLSSLCRAAWLVSDKAYEDNFQAPLLNTTLHAPPSPTVNGCWHLSSAYYVAGLSPASFLCYCPTTSALLDNEIWGDSASKKQS